jgi:acyl-CoA reductase-like NAD-dependent aldehyde dehydrogenase
MTQETITTISPITGKPILTRQGLSISEIPSLLSASKKAFSTFQKTHPLAKRQEIVRKALDILLSKTDELAKELTEQMGRPIAYTGKEIATAVMRAQYLLKVSDEVLSDSPGEAQEGFKRFIRKKPLGPVGIIIMRCFAERQSKTDMTIGSDYLRLECTSPSFLYDMVTF